MANIFKRLSDVIRKAKADPTDTMLVVDHGEVKQAPVPVAAQADWAVEDPENPACILNKPTSLGGVYEYIYFTESAAYRVPNADEIPTSDMLTENNMYSHDTLMATYKKKPLLFFMLSGYGVVHGPCANLEDRGNNILVRMTDASAQIEKFGKL